MIELRHLKHALELADCRNFARAAKALNLSQPALTRSIQVLEERMGVQLFVRGPKGVSTTDAGLLTLKRARTILGHANDLMREGHAMRSDSRNELRIAAGPYAADLVVGPCVASLLKKLPELRFTMRVDHWVKVVRMLEERRIDVAVCEGSELANSGLDVVPLRPIQAYVVVRAGHPLVEQKRQVDLNEVFRWPLAITARLPPRVIERLLPLFGEASFTPTVHCEDINMIRNIIVKSDAIGLLPLPMISNELELGLLKVVPIKVSWMRTEFSIVRMKDRIHSKEVISFAEQIAENDKHLLQVEEDLEKRFFKPRAAKKRASPKRRMTSSAK